jgi:hypothetical protein
MTTTLTIKHINHGEFFTFESLTDLLEAASDRLVKIQDMFGDDAQPLIDLAQAQFNFAESSVFAMASMMYAREVKLTEAQAIEAMKGVAYQLNVMLLAGVDARLVKSSDAMYLGPKIDVLMTAMNDFRTVGTREPDAWD